MKALIECANGCGIEMGWQEDERRCDKCLTEMCETCYDDARMLDEMQDPVHVCAACEEGIIERKQALDLWPGATKS